MKIYVEEDVLNYIGDALKEKQKSMVRFLFKGYTWSGTIFDVVLDEQKENDDITEIGGIIFGCDKAKAFYLNLGYKLLINEGKIVLKPFR